MCLRQSNNVQTQEDGRDVLEVIATTAGEFLTVSSELESTQMDWGREESGQQVGNFKESTDDWNVHPWGQCLFHSSISDRKRNGT